MPFRYAFWRALDGKGKSVFQAAELVQIALNSARSQRRKPAFLMAKISFAGGMTTVLFWCRMRGYANLFAHEESG